ncbi:hypothetical protein HRG84_08910 [Flavisolibacter sp. BT320]|nr:hypothetical protein [Flavisolibacter longurius]
MKYIFLFSISVFALTNSQAQKKSTAKPAAATQAVQKSEAAKPAATQTVFMATGDPASFKKLAGDARSNYDAGKLDDSRFALQQMLSELDIIIGKEVLKSLPATILDKPAITKQDNVTGASGFLGVVVHREYGQEYNSASSEENKNISVEIITNSPLIASINSLLSIPLIGNTGDNKVIKVSGYKALVTKNGDGDNVSYELQLPLGSSMITVKAPGATQEQVAQIAGSLPVQEIAKMLQ